MKRTPAATTPCRYTPPTAPRGARTERDDPGQAAHLPQIVRTAPRLRRVIMASVAGADDEGNTRWERCAPACLLCVPGRRRMSKAELDRAIA